MSVCDDISALIVSTLAAVGILYMWASFAFWEYSTLLTISVALQQLSLIHKVIYVRSLSKLTIEVGISKLALLLEGFSIACRLSSTLFFIGYLPIDASGDYLYQAIDLISLLLTLWLLHRLSSHERRLRLCTRQGDSWEQFLPIVMAALFLASLCHGSENARPLIDSVWMTGALLGAFSVAPQLLILLTCSHRNSWLLHASFATAGAWTCSALVMIKVICWLDHDHYKSPFGFMMLLIYTSVFVLHADALLRPRAGGVPTSAQELFSWAADMRSVRVAFNGGVRAICKVVGPSLCVCALSMHKSPHERGYRPKLLSWMLISATVVINFLFYTKDKRQQPVWNAWSVTPRYAQGVISMFSSCAGHITEQCSKVKQAKLILKESCKQQRRQRGKKLSISNSCLFLRSASQSLTAMRHGLFSWFDWRSAIEKAKNAYPRLSVPKQLYSSRTLCTALSLLLPSLLLPDRILPLFYCFVFGCMSKSILSPRMHVRPSAWPMPVKEVASRDAVTKASIVCSVQECTTRYSGDAPVAGLVEAESTSFGLDEITTVGVTANAVQPINDTTDLIGCRAQEAAGRDSCDASDGEVATDDASQHLCSLDDVGKFRRDKVTKTNSTISHVPQIIYSKDIPQRSALDSAAVERSLRGKPLWSDTMTEDDWNLDSHDCGRQDVHTLAHSKGPSADIAVGSTSMERSLRRKPRWSEVMSDDD